MEEKDRHWGRFSLTPELMIDHSIIVEALMEPLSIVSIIYDGKVDRFDFIATAPFFKNLPKDGIPPNHDFVFHIEDHPLGQRIYIGLREVE